MSVYKPEGKPFFLFDFQIKGRRYHGSTGQRTRRAAEAFEDRTRREVAEGKYGDTSRLTVRQALARMQAEHWSGLVEADRFQQRIELLLQIMDPEQPICDLTTAHISDAIEKRKAVGYTRSDAEDAAVYLPQNATINRDIIGMLRPMLNRARKRWGAKGLEEIDWAELSLDTPAEHIQYYTQAQRTAWRAECGPTTGLFLECLLTYGPRFGELFFRPELYDAEGQRVPILASGPGRKSRKADVPHIIRFLPRHAGEIAARAGRAIAADLPHIWFVEDKDADGNVVLVSIPPGGMSARLRSAAKRAGVDSKRLIHGARHHAGTDFLRSSKNLKLTQRLLGHADIKSTMRYAHALDDDLFAALEARDEGAKAPEKAPLTTDRKRRK